MKRTSIDTVTGSGGFADVIDGSPGEIQILAGKLRTLIADIMPGVTEVPWTNQNIAGYGVGPKKMSEPFCYIAPHGDHVNLGFMYGAELDDPAGLLEGNGKLLRHIKVRTSAELRSPALRELLEQASCYLPRLEGHGAGTG